MSYELGLKGKLDTTKQDLTLPKTILENISNELKAETDGEIEGMVLPYKGPIQSYTKKSGLAMFGIQTEQEVDIQDSLGAVGNKIERFEFCIAAQSFKEFRYRLMFIEYDLSVYPVTVVLEENISRQLKDKASLGYIVICKNREEFESIVVGAIKTKRVLEMMRQLLNAAENKSLNGNAENETDGDDNTDEIHVTIKK